MKHWLMKSEPSECSIDDLARAQDQTLPWVGVRNYQARNFMRDDMAPGDGVLFYHSSCPKPKQIGIAGLARVASLAYPDATQFDPSSPYFDAKSKPEAARWLNVDVRFERKTRLLSLADLRKQPGLAGMRLLQAGSRLSITPVSAEEWALINELLS
ncbi:EVE domain-containing protein [Roseateles sp.]|uniref:EVE domain-containing protein n=1 Tax=Roseateles sp. TaxID=1971397 RepID=UPI003D09B407